jgi:peptidoglycan/LPS O-acetylase OafA/YrhL
VAQETISGGIALCASVALLVQYIRTGGAKVFAALPFDYALTTVKPWGINFWPQSYLIGFLIALNIYGFARVQNIFKTPTGKFASLVCKTAEASFGLYLFHYPLMYFCKAVLATAGITRGSTYVVRSPSPT